MIHTIPSVPITTALVTALLAYGVAFAQYGRPEAASRNAVPFTTPSEELPPIYVAPIERLPPPFDLNATPETDLNRLPIASPGTDRLDTGEPGTRGPGAGGPGTGGSDMGKPGMGRPQMGGSGMGVPGYGVTWFPSTRVSDSNPSTTMKLLRQSLSGALPLWTNGRDMVMLTAGVENSLFSTDAVLPDSRRAFPDELWDIRIGTNYMCTFDNGWTGMAGINFGSASDQPFHSIDEMTVSFMSMLQMPAKNERDHWIFMLMYSPTGNVTFPIPGAAYSWHPSDSLRASLGIPFSITWRPTATWTVDVSYMPIITVHAMANYKLADGFSLYGGFQCLQEAYLLADRKSVDDRFMEFDKRLLVGVRWDVFRHATLDLSGGSSLDRYYGVGQNQIGGDLSDRIDIAPGPFASLSLHCRF